MTRETAREELAWRASFTDPVDAILAATDAIVELVPWETLVAARLRADHRAADDSTTERTETPQGRGGPILAASTWRTNGELIADVAKLGYLQDEWRMIDPTYGRGRWWTTWCPDRLRVHDIRLDGVDFRSLPHHTDTFDGAVYDPPYVSVGGRKSTGLPDLHDRYGLTDAPTSPAALQVLINDGLREVVRVTKLSGIVLVKCQDYISSGRFWPGTHYTAVAAMECGLEIVDRFEHVALHPRPQPSGRRQVHARRNLSTLFVFKKARRA